VFGQTMVPYAAFPGLLKPEKPSPRSFYRKSLDVAKQRLNVSGNAMYQSDANKTRLLSGMLTAYSVSTPYSLETDPAKVSFSFKIKNAPDASLTLPPLRARSAAPRNTLRR